MKNPLALMSLYLIISINGYSQKFVSDSVCYENITTGKKIRCDIPILDDEYGTYYRDLWEVERNGDFIKIVHWLRKPVEVTTVDDEGDTIPTLGSGNITQFNISYRDQEEITYITKKIKRSSQVFQGNASTGGRIISLALNWQLYDLNDDGVWDRLVLGWFEDSPIVRVIYFHLE